jgi:hypothetical protein
MAIADMDQTKLRHANEVSELSGDEIL